MTEMSIENAPDTIEGVRAMLPFQLRVLADALKGLGTGENQMAWHDQRTPEARAQYVFGLLQQHRKNAPSNGVQQVAPPQLAPTVANVSSDNIAAAAAATAAEKPKRSPRTSAAAPAAEAPADLGANVVELLSKLADASGQQQDAMIAGFKKMEAILVEASSAKSSRLEAAVATLAKQVESTNQLVQWTLMAVLTMAQETTGASLVDVLGAAIRDSNELNALAAKATGKG